VFESCIGNHDSSEENNSRNKNSETNGFLSILRKIKFQTTMINITIACVSPVLMVNNNVE